MQTIGIDPGLDGALSIIFEEAGTVIVCDTPVAVIGGGRTKKRDYLPELMRSLLAEVPSPRRAFIERVHSMPGQGVVSTFSLGKGFGIWLGLLVGLEIPVTIIEPARWKRRMLADMGKGKDASRARAMQLWPYLAEDLKREKDDGRAEAALIAEFGRLEY